MTMLSNAMIANHIWILLYLYDIYSYKQNHYKKGLIYLLMEALHNEIKVTIFEDFK